MSDEPKLEKRRIQFSLRSFIIMILLVSCILLASVHLGQMLYARLRGTDPDGSIRKNR